MAAAAILPGKSPDLVVRQEEPFNAGPPLDRLLRHPVTPSDLFFVRNHAPVPALDPGRHRLTVEGLVERALALTIDDLRRNFSWVQIEATLQCAGNRRSELTRVAPIPGELPWGCEAVSNARWAGAPLAEVLAEAGVLPEARHVGFTGLDRVERLGSRFGFGGSIPASKALAPEVLLAYEMNGEPLGPAHGAPLRALVPGYIGARSVKWLSRIELLRDPSENYFQARAYRLSPPDGGGREEIDWSRAVPLGELPVNSVICDPGEGAEVPAGRVTVAGWAMAGGGRAVERVDLSGDGGHAWSRCELLRGEPWAWCFWGGEVELPPGTHTLVVRALDAAAQLQPERLESVWNAKGYANNAWHRVTVTAV
ncbi:MAG TPA: molybdopterin-dependent oxidoreductase [Thermoanaerobaculia bacterium]|nr:molybdopterin-dependent oxidoreductase [Thermoanaerobaculia bacterium]